MKIFSTKHIFTMGIEEYEVTTIEGHMVTINNSFVGFIYLQGEGKDWHRTREEAIARAEDLRAKKIRALNRQLEKISAMDFENKKEK